MRHEVLVLGAIVLSCTAVATLLANLFAVNQCTIAIIQRFGSFLREVGPGLHIRVPFADRVVGRVDLRVQQLETVVHAKTIDDTFVHICVAVHYRILPDRVYDAFYGLVDARQKMTAAVSDIVMTQLAELKFDDLFRNCKAISRVVTNELTQRMQDFGYCILGSLVTDIDPDPKVEASMNELSAARRMRAAATERMLTATVGPNQITEIPAGEEPYTPKLRSASEESLMPHGPDLRALKRPGNGG